ncbi:MAG: SIMPL domain-containing protein [Bacteroidota bacterium]
MSIFVIQLNDEKVTMEKLLLPFIFVLCSMQTMAQNQGELAVLGEASIALKPTRTVIQYNVESTQSTYVAAVEDMTKRVDELANILSGMKFKEDEMITSSFRVQEKFAYDRGQRRNDGYTATQTLKVTFPLEKKRLLEVLSKTTSGLVNAGIAVSFTIDEAKREELNLQLIEEAVNDAKSKAETIARAAACKIQGIKEITYGTRPVAYPTPRLARAETLSMSAADAGGVEVSNFEAADLTFTDSVNVIYLIGPAQ